MHFIRNFIFFATMLFSSTTFAQVSNNPVTEQSSATSANSVQATEATSQNPAEALANAQKAYVTGKWQEASTQYEQVCPQLKDSSQVECYLWNVLALSQTGVAKDFSKAGKRLDSLIQKTNPQYTVYADLMMTRAQFQLYLGKYDKASESLIHAIETSKPHQAVVLKKVCAAIQAHVKKTELNEACERLNHPELLEQNKQAVQPDTMVKQSTKAQETAPAKSSDSKESVQAKSAEKNKDPIVNSSASAVTTKEVTKNEISSGHWTLQLGAFGIKENADLLMDNLKKRGFSAIMEERKSDTKTLYVVQSGVFDNKEQANEFGNQKLTPLNIEFKAILKK